MSQPGIIAMGTACAVHRHRTAVPLVSHHIWPLGLDGPNVRANRVVVCADGHGETHNVLNLLAVGPLPWRTRLRYGRRVRQLAQRGWDAYTAHQEVR